MPEKVRERVAQGQVYMVSDLSVIQNEFQKKKTTVIFVVIQTLNFINLTYVNVLKPSRCREIDKTYKKSCEVLVNEHQSENYTHTQRYQVLHEVTIPGGCSNSQRSITNPVLRIYVAPWKVKLTQMITIELFGKANDVGEGSLFQIYQHSQSALS